jgi:hypothetical protein
MRSEYCWHYRTCLNQVSGSRVSHWAQATPGRSFDLETDRQVAEFKFIAWRGGAEAIRQNGLFIDIFRLAGGN